MYPDVNHDTVLNQHSNIHTLVYPESFGSREPTCPELLKTSELSEEQQRSEFSSLCRFYAQSCSPSQGTAACSLQAEEKCLSRFKKCRKCLSRNTHSYFSVLL